MVLFPISALSRVHDIWYSLEESQCILMASWCVVDTSHENKHTVGVGKCTSVIDLHLIQYFTYPLDSIFHISTRFNISPIQPIQSYVGSHFVMWSKRICEILYQVDRRQRDLNFVQDSRSYGGINVQTDHKLVRAKLNIRWYKMRTEKVIPGIDKQKLKAEHL